jgi:hypothetical protein
VPPPIALRPDATETYREKVKDLKAALNAADQENRTMAYEVIRELIDEVVIRPHGPYKPVEIDLYAAESSRYSPRTKQTRGLWGCWLRGLATSVACILTMRCFKTDPSTQ